VSLPIRPTRENLHYLRTKRDRMGHDLPNLDAVEGLDDRGTGGVTA
jgi:3,4-dihydroxy 2-butanone 4-phosphate synthase/GTP cyclohydrolase II